MKRSNTKNQLYTIYPSNGHNEEYQENKVILPADFNFELDPSSIFWEENNKTNIKELHDMTEVNNYLQQNLRSQRHTTKEKVAKKIKEFSLFQKSNKKW